MLLGEVLHDGVVTTALRATEKYAAIAELTDRIIAAGRLSIGLRDHALAILKAREVSMSTGMEHGIALPHASSDRVDEIVGALGVAPRGIEWECLDLAPARLIILLITPRRQFQVHVRTLAGISHLLNDDAFCDSLVASKNANELLARVREEERDPMFDSYRGVSA